MARKKKKAPAKAPAVKVLKITRWSPREFQGWWQQMAPVQLQMLEKFARGWKELVLVSPAKGAVGRNLGPDARSAHNVDKWGAVFATDVFPLKLEGAEGIQRALTLAKAAGATGFGVYTDVHRAGLRALMLHLDTRPSDHFRTWARVNGKYVGLEVIMPSDWKKPTSK